LTIPLLSRHQPPAIAMKQISEEKGKKYIVPIVYSIAESKYETHLRPLAILYLDQIIGFSMYCKDPDDGRYWLYVYMIDEAQQGKGYGKEGIKQLLKYIQKQEKDIHEVVIGHRPDNERAGYLYESAGFKKTGEIINGEIIREFKYFTEVGTIGTYGTRVRE